MSHPPTFTPGRLILTSVGLTCILGPYFADFNHTHVLNPAWPPHAKFHNGQTMSLGLLLGLLTVYYTWRTPPYAKVTSPSSSAASVTAARKDSITTASLIASLYWVAGVSAILYPGTAWVDPEFYYLLDGREDPQARVFSGMIFASVVGWGVERWVLGRWERRVVKRE